MIRILRILHCYGEKKKKIIFYLLIFAVLNGFTLATGCDDGTQAEEKNSKEANLLRMDRSLVKDLEAKVNDRVKKYEKGNFSKTQIAQDQKNTHDEYNLEKEKNETEFNREYNRLLDALYRLGEIKLNLYNIHEEIKYLTAQITGLTQWITLAENNRKIYEYHLKQRLQSIPIYFLLLGKATVKDNSKEDNRQQIIDDMKKFLIKQELQVELNPASKFSLPAISLDEKSIVPDGREYCEVKDGNIYTYKVFRFYPFAIKNEMAKPSSSLDKLYQYFFNGDEAVEVVGYKIKPEEKKPENIKCIDFNSDQEDPTYMINSSDYGTKNMCGWEPGSELIGYLKNSYKKDLKTINRGLEEYRRKSDSILKDILNKKNELIGNSRPFESLIGKVKAGINDLSNFARDMQQGTVSSEKIKETKNNIDSTLKAFLGNLDKGEDFQKQLETISKGFRDIFSTIDELSLTLNVERKKLIEERKMIYLACGESRNVPGENGNRGGSFMDAANNALDLIREEMAQTCPGIAGLDENNNINTLTGGQFYRQGKIEELVVPLVYKITPGVETTDSRYRVFLKARIVFQVLESPDIKDYAETVKDPLYNITWAKDMGAHLVYDGSAGGTVLSRLEGLNRSLTENERANQPWTLASKSDLEKLLNRQNMLEKLHIRLNRNYWTSERAGIYYRGYRFQEKANRTLELVEVKLISSDGAYCIFVRKDK